MRTQRLHEWGGSQNLSLDEVDAPTAGVGQVRIAVEALGVNPVDWKLMTGKAPVLPSLPLTPGGDVAGTIDAVGEEVEGFRPGDRVFGLIGLTGAYAEYVVTSAANVVPIPDGLDARDAAALPLVSLTAMQGLAADGRELSGLRVLVHGGAGGVGMAAIQIAKAGGAAVVATASAAKADYVRGLGADEVVDFRSDDPSGHQRSFDILLDLVGNSQETGLWPLVREGGSVIRIGGGATAPDQETVDGVRAYKVRVRPNGEQMRQVAVLARDGKLKVHVQETFDFARAVDAIDLVKEGRVRGKVVLTTSATR